MKNLPKAFKCKISLWSEKNKNLQSAQFFADPMHPAEIHVSPEETITRKLEKQYEKQAISLLANQQDPTSIGWEKKYETYANYLEGQNFMQKINSIAFGNTIINPYHIFQIRRLPGISAQMRICKDQTWFKIHDVLSHPETARFLNIITIPIPKLSKNFSNKSSENIP